MSDALFVRHGDILSAFRTVATDDDLQLHVYRAAGAQCMWVHADYDAIDALIAAIGGDVAALLSPDRVTLALIRWTQVRGDVAPDYAMLDDTFCPIEMVMEEIVMRVSQ